MKYVFLNFYSPSHYLLGKTIGPYFNLFEKLGQKRLETKAKSLELKKKIDKENKIFDKWSNKP